MSGDDHGTTGELDLDGIEARLHAGTLSLARLNHVQNVNFARLNIAATMDDVPALVAEVRRLRGDRDYWKSTAEMYRGNGKSMERLREKGRRGLGLP